MMNADYTIKTIRDALVMGAAGAYYGLVFEANPLVAACALAVTAIAEPVFVHAAQKMGHTTDNKIVAEVLARISIKAIALVAYRRLNLIAELGTIVVGFAFVGKTIEQIDLILANLRRTRA
jgi:hypothetical protein